MSVSHATDTPRAVSVTLRHLLQTTFLAVVMSVALFLGACGGETQREGGLSCEAMGATQGCSCAADDPGVQVCQPDGDWSSCLCGVVVADVCGDGVTDPGEACDDGNVTGGDGCSAGCALEVGCGDGACDAGESYVSCPADCTAPAPVDCELSAFSAWSDCSATCDGGTQTRTRSVVTPNANGGAACGALSETEDCNVDACIDAYSATVVMYDQGGFAQISERQWVENNPDGTYMWTEKARDEWSIYLTNSDRGDAMQLDLWTDELKYTGPGSDTKTVVGAIADVDVENTDGWTLNHLTYDGGAFVQLNATDWVENNPTGPHIFKEQKRDAWSVYLWDASRGVAVQLDVWTGEVKYTPPGGNQYVLYDIDDVAPDRIDGWLAREATRPTGARFLQVAPRTWLELEPNGAVFATFEQTSRDEWSVYLRDNSRNIGIILDHWTMDILYLAPGASDAVPLYTITDVR